MFFFFFNDTATTEIYTLSLHDALPISLRQEIGDGDARGRRRKRRDGGVGAERLDRRVAPVPPGRAWSRRLAMNLEHAIDEVDDPVVHDPRPCIGRSLPSSGQAQARLGDLDDERRARRMRVDVIARRAADDADGRLRLGPVAEDDRTL